MPIKLKHGGKRAGSGAKKGRKYPKTMEKLEARRVFQETVIREMGPLVRAQIANAQGIKYLVVRERRGGKFKRVAESMAKLAENGKLGKDEEIIEVWEKDPSVQAFTDLMNRALDKPKEQEVAVEVTGGLELHWGDKE